MNFCIDDRPAFIFMLTRHDATIADAFVQVEPALAAGIRWIGFKDIGLPLEQLHALVDRIKSTGACACLEVVSLDEACEIRSAQAAVALGVDVLMGGTRPECVLPIIEGHRIGYYPFAGTIVGHPSVLTGSIASIVESAKRLAGLERVHGIDLLAWRFEGDAGKLIAQVRAAIGPKPLIVAGSIDCAERIDTIVASGAAAFTVGTAALDGAFTSARPNLPDQLAAIQRLRQQAIAGLARA